METIKTKTFCPTCGGEVQVHADEEGTCCVVPVNDRESEMKALLKRYEEWEAMLIADNAMWWPNVPKDRISGKSYDMMMELQAERNRLLKSIK